MNQMEASTISNPTPEIAESLNSIAWATMPQILRKCAAIIALTAVDLLSMVLVLAASIQIRLGLLPLIYPYFPDKLPENLTDYGWAILGTVLAVYVL